VNVPHSRNNWSANFQIKRSGLGIWLLCSSRRTAAQYVGTVPTCFCSSPTVSCGWRYMTAWAGSGCCCVCVGGLNWDRCCSKGLIMYACGLGMLELDEICDVIGLWSCVTWPPSSLWCKVRGGVYSMSDDEPIATAQTASVHAIATRTIIYIRRRRSWGVREVSWPPLFVGGGQLMVLRPPTFIRSFRWILPKRRNNSHKDATTIQ